MNHLSYCSDEIQICQADKATLLCWRQAALRGIFLINRLPKQINQEKDHDPKTWPARIYL